MNHEPIPKALRAELEHRFGPLRLADTKRYSVHYCDARVDRRIKIYRGISPIARQERELVALRTAGRHGIRIPRVLADGRHKDLAWAALAAVPGTPLHIRQPGDAVGFLTAAGSLLASLHAHQVTTGPGYGWTGPAAATVSQHLVGQLSPHVRTLPTWLELRALLRELDDAPIVRLHGDVKPEHILVTPAGVVLVDWEACARGPAILDDVDAIFRVLRDLAYAGSLTPETLTSLPRSRHRTIALAWRLCIWLDRRHDTLTGDAAALATEAMRLPNEPDPIGNAATIINDARNHGVRY